MVALSGSLSAGSDLNLSDRSGFASNNVSNETRFSRPFPSSVSAGFTAKLVEVREAANKEEIIDAGFKMFSHLVQRIESSLLLDIACYRIAKENPAVPLITIHNCIATIPVHVDYVERVIKEELKAVTGFEVTIKHEPWNGK